MSVKLEPTLNYLKEKIIKKPKACILLGSCLSDYVSDAFLNSEKFKLKSRFKFEDIPQVPKATAPGHVGEVIVFEYENELIVLQSGRIFPYENLEIQKTILLTRCLGLLNPELFILTNPAGCLVKEWPLGSCMLYSDHLNLTGRNPLFGQVPLLDGKEIGPRYPDMSRVYSDKHTKKLKVELVNQNLEVQSGVYVGINGPSFETPIEIQGYVSQGLHAIGMSTVWEAITLKHLGLDIVGLSVMSNYAAGLTDVGISHEEVDEITQKCSYKVATALESFIGKI